MASNDTTADADLKAQFDGDVVASTDPDYDRAISRWARNSQRRARFVCYPKDSDGVAAIVKWAVSKKIAIAVCGGGHSTSGASSVEDGLVIGLSRYLNKVRVDADKKLAYIGGGCNWKDVDEAAIKHGLATVGGTVNDTGVGGLLLGGGYGFLSGEYGLVIDNLVEATIVTAAGQTLRASESENPDLFWGIRGGGGNFGIATEFVLKLHPQRRKVFAGQVVFPGPMVDPVFKALYKWWDAKPTGKENVLAFLANPPPDKHQIILLILFYNGSEVEGREKFKWLYDLGPVADTCKEIPYEEVNTLQKDIATYGRGVFMSGSTQESYDYPVKVSKKLAELDEYPNAGFAAGFEFFPLSAINSVAPEATAFSSRGAKSNILIMAGWTKPDSEVRDKAAELVMSVKSMLEASHTYAMSKGENTGYTNYEATENPNASQAAKAFKYNYPRLQELKAKYDPNEVFSRWYGIAPART